MNRCMNTGRERDRVNNSRNSTIIHIVKRPWQGWISCILCGTCFRVVARYRRPSGNTVTFPTRHRFVYFINVSFFLVWQRFFWYENVETFDDNRMTIIIEFIEHEKCDCLYTWYAFAYSKVDPAMAQSMQCLLKYVGYSPYEQNWSHVRPIFAGASEILVINCIWFRFYRPLTNIHTKSHVCLCAVCWQSLVRALATFQ